MIQNILSPGTVKEVCLYDFHMDQNSRKGLKANEEHVARNPSQFPVPAPLTKPNCGLVDTYFQ